VYHIEVPSLSAFKRRLAFDDFNRSDEDLGSPNWEQVGKNGNIEIVSNEVKSDTGAAPGTSAAARYIGADFSPDQYASISLNGFVFAPSNNSCGVIVRASHDGNVDADTRDFYFVQVHSGAPAANYQISFGKVNNGTETLWLNNEPLMFPGNNHRIGLIAVGSMIAVTIDSNIIGGKFIITDFDLVEGNPGIAAGGNSVPQGDDWEAGNVELLQFPIFTPAVVITDVNTTESWTDGDTGLVIKASFTRR
jgi:hypothetical protein